MGGVVLNVVEVLSKCTGGDAGACGCCDEIFHSLSGRVGEEANTYHAHQIAKVFSSFFGLHLELPLSDDQRQMLAYLDSTGISAWNCVDWLRILRPQCPTP